MLKLDPATLQQMMTLVGKQMGGLTPNARVSGTTIPRGLQADTAQATRESVMGSIADNQRAQQMQIEQQNAKDMLSMKERQLAIDSANTMFEHGMQQKQLDATTEGNKNQLELTRQLAGQEAEYKDKALEQDKTLTEAQIKAKKESDIMGEKGANYRANLQNSNQTVQLDPAVKFSQDKVVALRSNLNNMAKAGRDLEIPAYLNNLLKTETDPAVIAEINAVLGDNTGLPAGKNTQGTPSGIDWTGTLNKNFGSK